MLFHAAAILTDRHGRPFREPKADEKADPKTGVFADEQMRQVRYGDVALLALDTALEGDDKLMKESGEKWVKAVMKRDAISTLISTALREDGWATLKEEQKDLLVERLALCCLRLSVAMVGPVMRVLENPPEAKPESAPKGAGPGQKTRRLSAVD